MRCLNCHHELRAEDAFCSQCGTATAPICSKCSQPNEKGSQFCAHCGHSLGSPLQRTANNRKPQTGAHVGERKRLTVLFADIRNSTEWIDQIDPEEALDRISPIIDLMKTAVARFDGTVMKVQGDGIMALFGAPKAHEHHAACACLAALDMQEAIDGFHRQSVRIRVGIHTGEVVLYKTDGVLTQSYDASGVTVHLASRMEQQRETAGILITTDTYQAARHLIDARPLGSLRVKGLRSAVQVYELVGKKQAPISDQFRATTYLSELSGRETELSLLRTEREAAESGDGRVVSIIGEAGIGKSRLCFEFAEECRASGVNVFEARVSPYGKATPLQPALELIRGYFGIRSSDTKDAARDLIVRRMASIGGFEDTTPILLDFLGLQHGSDSKNLDPNTRKLRLLRLIRRLPKLGRGTLNVVLIEDLHWIDAASEEFVAALADGVAGSKTLLLLNHRPGVSSEFMQRSHYRQLSLGPLNTDLARQLVSNRLGTNPDHGLIATEIARRAQGNPFFLEELAQAVIEKQTGPGKFEQATASLPTTIHAVLSARIDRLDETAKETLQIAAVVGRGFSTSLLSQISSRSEDDVEQSLSRLRNVELLFEADLFGKQVHEFRHPLIQEVAYESLLRSRRKELHLKAATSLEAELKDRLDENAGLIAFHLEQADELEKAAQLHTRGAFWAGANDSAQALRSWKKVHELLKSKPGPTTDYLRMMACGQTVNFGWREGITAEEAEQYFAEAREIALRIGDRRANALLLAGYGRVLAASGSADDYVSRVQEALNLSMTTSDSSLDATLKAILCNALRLAGRMTEALPANLEALARCDEVRTQDRQLLGFDVRTWLIGMRGSTLIYMDRGDEATPWLEEVLGMNPNQVDTTHFVLPSVAYVDLAAFKKDIALAEAHAARAISIAEKSASPYLWTYALCCRAIAHRLAERPKEAISDLKEGLSFSMRRRAGREIEARMHSELGSAYFEYGETNAALASFSEAINVANKRHARLAKCQALIGRATALLSADVIGLAQADLDEAQSIIEATGAKAYVKAFEEVASDLRRRA